MTLLEAVVALTVATLGVAGTVLAVVLPLLISTRRKAAAATQAGIDAKEAVTNGHPEHIRDMLDRFHRENQEAIGGVVTELAGVKSDVRGVRRDVGRVADRQERLDERIVEIERGSRG